jgi:site-specific DNA-cytosine methylase
VNVLLPTRRIEFRHFHLFCGLAGGARGFNRGHARVEHLEASFRCIGGVDVDPAAIRDFGRLAGARGTVLDMFSRDQYRAFRGQEPPDGWREATPEDIRRAAGYERPHILFGSAPCKGFSGLLSGERAAGARYQALNQLAIRGLWLALEAWSDDPPEFFLWENVPRIATRGREVLDTMVRLLESYGYAVAETTHDCGELGNLAQSRKRFLLVARHREKVPPFLYEPHKRPLRGVGEVLGAFPLPGDPAAGPMHAMRQLQWKTWVRLAFVEAGGDWRSLEKLRVADGHLVDFAIAPETEWHRGTLGVCPWNEPSGTVTGAAMPTTGPFSVADPRIACGPEAWAEGRRGLGVIPWADPAGTITSQARAGQGAFAVADPRTGMRASKRTGRDPEYGQLGVRHWEEPAGAVSGQSLPGGGRYSVADPRMGNRNPAFNNVYRVVRWQEPAPAVTGPGGGGTQMAVADPRSGTTWNGKGKYAVTRFEDPAGTVIAASTTGNGAFAVGDPRIQLAQGRGAYGVLPWDAPSGAVTGQASHDNGRFNVADPRGWSKSNPCRCPRCQLERVPLPAHDARLVAVIRALDGTWHRPFTTLELAALQGLVDPDEDLVLDGTSDSAWRERIGNAVPSPAAAAIASVMAQTLLLVMSGVTFALGSTPIWVRPVAIALSVAQPEGIA